MISSTTNTKIKSVLALRDKSKVRKERGAFIIEGSRSVYELTKENCLELYVSEHFLQQADAQEKERLAQLCPTYETVTDTVFGRLSDTRTPQGILAVAKMPEHTLQELQRTASLLLLLERIQDPGNMGTLLRSAEAAGVTGVIVSEDSADIFQPKVVRATMGSLMRLPIVRTKDFIRTVKELQEEGIALYAAALSGAVPYDKADWNRPCGVMIGNEGAGLSKEAQEAATKTVQIPMAGAVESLNAAVAASVLLFEAARQRRANTSVGE